MRWAAVLGLGALLAAEVVPGGAQPAAPAEPQAVIFLWDHYRSVAVVGEGVGLRRPAWIGTWDLTPAGSPLPPPVQVLAGMFGYTHLISEPPLAVAYRALAWRDDRGRLHLVAKGAALAGPQADAWSPDSFVIDGLVVSSEDDQQATQQGQVIETVRPPSEAYQTHLLMIQILCGDGI